MSPRGDSNNDSETVTCVSSTPHAQFTSSAKIESRVASKIGQRAASSPPILTVCRGAWVKEKDEQQRRLCD